MSSLVSPTVLLSAGILTAFSIAYFSISPFFSSDKQRAYILSTISSFTMTCISLPFLWIYLSQGLGVIYEAGQTGWLGDLSWFGVVFFATYLFGMLSFWSQSVMADLETADLAIGYLMYPSQVGLLTGWIHHTVYIGLMIHLLNTRLSPMFLVPSVMELPTFDLAISHLFPVLRNDARFLSLMFLTRILFHAVYLIHAALPSSRAISDGSYVPTVMLSLALALHVGWFKGGFTGYLKRRAALKKRAEKTSVDDTPVPELEGEKHLVIDAEGPGTPEANTPDESPLLTPYTPSQTPLTIRDAYFFPIPIPTLPQMTMPNLPTMSIPPLPTMPSFSDFTSALPKGMNKDMGGFKDAVKGRWEAERGRFASMRGGRGMSLSLGGLRLRRGKEEGADGEIEHEDVMLGM